jgi:ornithine decarboxylase
MERYRDVGSAVRSTLPELPLYIHRPHSVAFAARWFKQNFKGKVLYAVKTNPHPAVVRQLWDAGIKHFDVASLPEIELVKKVAPEAKMYFMHPVKPREAIAKAYFDHGVKTFALDSFVELEKILAATNYAKNLRLMIRIAVNSNYAEISLNKKFGISPEDAPELLRHARKFSRRLGICFHVGSQSMHPDAFSEAIEKAGRIIEESGVKVDVLDVGGGFPSVYPGMNPPDLERYMQTIHRSTMKLDMGGVKLWCEPGRALVAESGSLVVRVD